MNYPAVHAYATTASTNDDIHSLAEAGAPDGTVVVATTMTAGRGSRRRPWVAGPGGLWISICRRPTVALDTGVLSLRVGLAVAEVVEQYPGLPVALKWPNDIMLDDKKVGGVLCEMRWQGDEPAWVAIGLGINVVNPLPVALRSTAITLADRAPRVTVEHLRDVVVPALRNVAVDAGRLLPAEVVLFDQRNWLHARVVSKPVAGTVAGIDRDGALQVVDAAGARHAVRSSRFQLAHER